MQLRFSWRFAALALLSLIATASTPSPHVVAQDKASTSQGFVLGPGEHKLGDILRSAAKYLGRNFFMNPNEVDSDQNTVEIQKKLNLDAIGCEEVVSQIAYMKGFTIVPIDPLRGLYDVISDRGERLREIINHALHLSPDEVLRKSKLKVCVLTSFSLKHIDAARAAQQLRPFFMAGGSRNGISFGTAGTQQSLILQGYAGQVASAIRLLREVDMPQRQVVAPPRREPSKHVSQQLAGLLTATNANTTSRLAMQKRLADLEARLAVLESSRKKL